MNSTRPTGPQYVTVVTEVGYRMHATVTLDWERGAALYRVAELGGTITVGWQSGHYYLSCCGGDAIEITYGKPTPSPFTEHFEDAPTVYGVQLAQQAVFHSESMSPTSHRWLVVRRETGGHYSPTAPEGTQRRTAAIVYAITHHMLTRPWAAELRRAHNEQHAPARYRHHQQAIQELEEEVAQLQEKLTRERERAAAQVAMIEKAETGEARVTALHVPVGEARPIAA
ncbi:bZIP transcription factor [Kitasatospora sp. NPDC059088]|uniref:bZIP transcription factor n=1 Tax=Kitasatospora sp. NPDC059088 TaxID=3346722 RepID=UPI0036C24D0F